MSDEEIYNLGITSDVVEVEELTAEEAEMRERSKGDYQQDEESDNELSFN